MSFDKQHVMGAAASEREAAIKYIDGNFGLLSGMTSATDRMIQCYIAGALEASSRQEERLRKALDVQAERAAFESWWRMWCPDREMPSTASHIFDAWLARARAALEPPHAKDAADV